MILLIDNYDSFTFNLFHYFGELGADVAVHRNDKITVATDGPEAGGDRPVAWTLHPERGRHLSDLIPRHRQYSDVRRLPGPQAIGQAFGGEDRARAGAGAWQTYRTSSIKAAGVFRGINGTFRATRYHSLVVDAATCPLIP